MLQELQQGRRQVEELLQQKGTLETKIEAVQAEQASGASMAWAKEGCQPSLK